MIREMTLPMMLAMMVILILKIFIEMVKFFRVLFDILKFVYQILPFVLHVLKENKKNKEDSKQFDNCNKDGFS